MTKGKGKPKAKSKGRTTAKATPRKRRNKVKKKRLKLPWLKILKYSLAAIIGLGAATGLSYYYLRYDKPRFNKIYRAVFPNFRPPSIIKKKDGGMVVPSPTAKAMLRRSR